MHEPRPQRPQTGDILGSYRILDVIGDGGMGRVYLAEHVQLGRRVALKLLHPEFAQNPSAVRRFFGEAHAVNQIHHDHIVNITDFINDAGDRKYYIMELLEGQTLQQRLAEGGALPNKQLLEIAIQIADALAAVHAADIVHRDLKPDNIVLITHGGRANFVKIVDFGVAKLAGDGPALHPGTTGVGSIMGTPEYMSPEQVSGKHVDHRTDIYALGVLLYEMATGRKPFTGHSFGEMVIKHLTVEPTRPSALPGEARTLPAALEDLILECLAKDREGRPESMAAVRDRLERIALDFITNPAGIRLAKAPWSPFAKVALGAALAAALSGALFLTWSWPPATGDGREALAAVEPSVLAPEAPPPPEPPPLPTSISVDLRSVPSGASVFREGQAVPIGVTPLTLALERSDATTTFELHLRGYAKAKQVVPLARDGWFSLSLHKERPRVASQPPVPPAGASSTHDHRESQ